MLGLVHHHEKHAASPGSHKFACPFPSLSDKDAVTSTGTCWWSCVCMSAFAPGCTREGLQKRRCLVMQVVEGLRGQSRLRAGTCLGCVQGFVHTRVCAWAALTCLCAHKAACTRGLAHWHMSICSPRKVSTRGWQGCAAHPAVLPAARLRCHHTALVRSQQPGLGPLGAGMASSVCLCWCNCHSTWLCTILVLPTTSLPREGPSGLQIHVCEDVPTALTDLTALEARPVSLVIHH